MVHKPARRHALFDDQKEREFHPSALQAAPGPAVDETDSQHSPTAMPAATSASAASPSSGVPSASMAPSHVYGGMEVQSVFGIRRPLGTTPVLPTPPMTDGGGNGIDTGAKLRPGDREATPHQPCDHQVDGHDSAGGAFVPARHREAALHQPCDHQVDGHDSAGGAVLLTRHRETAPHQRCDHQADGHDSARGASLQSPTLTNAAPERSICGDDTHTGEVLHVAKSYAWVKPLGRVPPEIEAQLSALNAEMRAYAVERKQPFCGGATDAVVFVAVADIKENDLVLEVGKLVLFKFYQDSRSVGGCEVTSASPSPSSLPAGRILLAESPPKSARRKSYTETEAMEVRCYWLRSAASRPNPSSLPVSRENQFMRLFESVLREKAAEMQAAVKNPTCRIPVPLTDIVNRIVRQNLDIDDASIFMRTRRFLNNFRFDVMTDTVYQVNAESPDCLQLYDIQKSRASF